jgi:hypothetical protein
MEDRLLTVWAQIRNIINLAFVVILIGIALYNVLGIGGEEGNYSIKKLLPKIMLALVLVNFTFVASKVILDASNVMTNAVFALPNAVEESFSLTRIDEIEPEVCESLNNATGFDSDEISSVEESSSFRLCEDNNTFTETGRDFFSNLSSNNIALVMAINMGQIHKGIDVSQLVLNEPTLSNLTINILFSVALYFVHASAYIALFFVLLVRVVVLWIIIAVSPIIAVQIAIPEIGDKISGKANLKDEFVKHAIAPIIIGFGMTLSYLMLDAYHRTSTASLGVQLGADFANAFSGTSTLQQLIVAIASVAVVFVVTFAAADDTAARSVTQRIRTFTTNIGRWASRQPLNAQVFPTGNVDDQGNMQKASFQQMLNTGQNVMNRTNGRYIPGYNPSNFDRTGGGDGGDNRAFNNASELRSYVSQDRLHDTERSVEAFRSMYAFRNEMTNREALKILEHIDPAENGAAQPYIDDPTALTNLRDRFQAEVDNNNGGGNVNVIISDTNTIDNILRDREAYQTQDDAFGNNNSDDNNDS